MLHDLLWAIGKWLVRWVIGSAIETPAVAPSRLEVGPTLRGLRVKPNAESISGSRPVVYAWDVVGRANTSMDAICWQAFHADGRRVEVEGQPLQLVMPNEKIGRVAKRAQRRYLRGLWNHGRLQVSEDYAPALRQRSARKYLLFSLLMVAIFTAVFLRVWAFPKPGLTREKQFVATGIFAPGVFMFIGIPILLWVKARHTEALLNIAQATFTNEGVAARSRDGSETWHEWATLVDVHDGFDKIRVEFNDGAALYFNQEPRTTGVLELVAEQYRDRISEQVDMRARKLVRWLLLIAVTGLGFVAALIYALVSGTSNLRALAQMPCMLLAFPLVLLPVLVVIKVAEKRVHQRRRRRQREQAQHSQPLT